MKKNLTELVFILDRSGSMAGLEKDTIGGFNAMIEKQKAEAGEAYISTVLFDNHSEVIHDRVALNAVPKLTEKEYYVRGCTALLDAVGGAIHHIGNVHKYNQSPPGKISGGLLFVCALCCFAFHGDLSTVIEEYKELVRLTSRNEEKLLATMTEEQKVFFTRYTDCVREYQAMAYVAILRKYIETSWL